MDPLCHLPSLLTSSWGPTPGLWAPGWQGIHGRRCRQLCDPSISSSSWGPKKAFRGQAVVFRIHSARAGQGRHGNQHEGHQVDAFYLLCYSPVPLRVSGPAAGPSPWVRLGSPFILLFKESHLGMGSASFPQVPALC